MSVRHVERVHGWTEPGVVPRRRRSAARSASTRCARGAASWTSRVAEGARRGRRSRAAPRGSALAARRAPRGGGRRRLRAPGHAAVGHAAGTHLPPDAVWTTSRSGSSSGTQAGGRARLDRRTFVRHSGCTMTMGLGTRPFDPQPTPARAGPVAMPRNGDPMTSKISSRALRAFPAASAQGARPGPRPSQDPARPPSPSRAPSPTRRSPAARADRARRGHAAPPAGPRGVGAARRAGARDRRRGARRGLLHRLRRGAVSRRVRRRRRPPPAARPGLREPP